MLLLSCHFDGFKKEYYEKISMFFRGKLYLTLSHHKLVCNTNTKKESVNSDFLNKMLNKIVKTLQF